MQSRLIVKNFGPIKHVDLDLRNVNVFIGPQASGKSALAKLFTICQAPMNFLGGSVKEHFWDFLGVLEEYNIKSFLKEETEISFASSLHTFQFRNREVTYSSNLRKEVGNLERLATSFQQNHQEIVELLNRLSKQYILFGIYEYDYFVRDEYQNILAITPDHLGKVLEILNQTERDLSRNSAIYIPAERNFINIIRGAALSLMVNNVPIPKHILLFGSEIEKAAIGEIDLSFLSDQTVYMSINGEQRIHMKDGQSIKLTESASGLQSVVPILIPILRVDTDDKNRHKSFVIEEPEMNLFPDAQYKLIRRLSSFREEFKGGDWGEIHTYTTHSPYILSALNILLYAHKVEQFLVNKFNKSDQRSSKDEFDPLDGRFSGAIAPEYFSAFQIKDGEAESIFNRESGLIMDNYIDDVTDMMDDDFGNLMELMR